MRQQSIVLLFVLFASAGSIAAAVRGNPIHGILASTGWFTLPPSEPVRLIVIGLSLIGISLLVRRWASR